MSLWSPGWGAVGWQAIGWEIYRKVHSDREIVGEKTGAETLAESGRKTEQMSQGENERKIEAWTEGRKEISKGYLSKILKMH